MTVHDNATPESIVETHKNRVRSILMHAETLAYACDLEKQLADEIAECCPTVPITRFVIPFNAAGWREQLSYLTLATADYIKMSSDADNK